MIVAQEIHSLLIVASPPHARNPVALPLPFDCVVPCSWAIYGCSISPCSSDVCVHIDAATVEPLMPTIKPNPADNSEHEAHSYMSRASSNNAGVGVCFPSLHLFYNGNFELWKISGIDSKKKKKTFSLNLLKWSCSPVSRAPSVCEVALRRCFFLLSFLYLLFLLSPQSSLEIAGPCLGKKTKQKTLVLFANRAKLGEPQSEKPKRQKRTKTQAARNSAVALKCQKMFCKSFRGVRSVLVFSPSALNIRAGLI